MFQKYLKIFVYISVILALAACNAPATPAPTVAAPTQAPPTATPLPTMTSPPTATPTPEATATPAKPKELVTDLTNVKNAVIRITTEGKFADPDSGAVEEGGGSGSGFIISPDGIAVTNNHVVTGAARIKVFFSDSEKAYNARILGVSECSDLAVIDIEGDGFPYLEWFEEKPILGQKVFSFGFPLGDPNITRHEGSISKEKADGNSSWTAIDTVLEHDAIINPGNSGGPLVTEDARVIGVNYASNPDYNMYFAIEASRAIKVVKELETGNDFESLGINGSAFEFEESQSSGIWIYSVASGSPADKAGVLAGDFLYEMEGVKVGRGGVMTDYCDVIRTHQPDDVLDINIYRGQTGEFLAGQINGDPLQVTEVASTDATTEAPAGEAPDFFYEEFEGSIDNWSYFHFGQDNADFDVYREDGYLIFDIRDPDTYIYLLYDPYIYTDVRIDALVANRAATNKNNFSLVCRYDEQLGWYEFNVSSGGLWSILRYNELDNEYILLFNGGSNNINMGQGENTFGLECQGKSISVYINDKKIKTVTDASLPEGQIGVSASSFETAPVTIYFDAVEIWQP